VFESLVAWTEKTGNRTGPNHGPVCFAASAAPVVDQSGCQLHKFSNNNEPGKDQLQLVFYYTDEYII
jgi:hypothetical protein